VPERRGTGGEGKTGPRPDRRRFFLAGLSKALDAFSDIASQVYPISIPLIRQVIRPPGALNEQDFQRTCYRCGSCVDACGPGALRLLQSSDEAVSGTPFVDPDLQACELCEGLPCTKACPSGALARIRREKVRMGLASWSDRRCLRTTGQECRACVDKCPIGLEAIRFGPQGRVEIVSAGCVGCGGCQQVCPARPKAIRVQPL